MRNTGTLLRKVREQSPLVHHITNWVTIYGCAAVTRAFGALPVMAHAGEESDEMAAHAQSLVLNIGTLTPALIDSMISAGTRANELDIPIVLDVVGAGATELRTDACRTILASVHADIVKGNAGEIGTLAGLAAEVKGVESVSLAGDPTEAATRLAEETNSVVAITGGEDIITDGKTALLAANGHPRMGEVVGTGCMAASAIGCFAAVEDDHLVATASALALYGMAGELAAEKAAGPGTFLACLIDAVAALDEDTVRTQAQIEETGLGER
ncbi:MAG: hydroxyethylthiazole kinase [Armatimonadia bacterium]|nr:hydroxyethylthiazole kinase [Armatimonadia bacterium]